MIEVRDLEHISHFDGKSNTLFECKRCKFNTHEDLVGQDDFCKPCIRVLTIGSIVQSLQSFVLPGIIMGILILFVNIFKPYSFLLPIIAIVVFTPALLTSMYINIYLYRGIPKDQRIAHYLINGKLISHNSQNYLENAYKILQTFYYDLNENQKIIIARNFVNNYLLNEKPNQPGLIKNWSKAYQMEVKDFIEYLFEETKLLEGFHFSLGVGLLPDIWPYVQSDSRKSKILDKLAEACNELDEAPPVQKSYFLEDLYLVEDEIIELAKSQKDWNIIVEKLEQFEPEEPPKNTLQSFLAQAQESSRAYEQQKLKQSQES